MKKFAFTLAEIMIVLSVIAILTAILLPSARNAMPNEKVMKFKKGHNTLYSAISELVNSDKYYLNGDLGVRADGKLLSEFTREPEINAYFCQTFADVVSAKYVDCVYDSNANGGQLIFNCLESTNWQQCAEGIGREVTLDEIRKMKQQIDLKCQVQTFKKNITAKQFIIPDNTWYYNPAPATTFGGRLFPDEIGNLTYVRVFSSPYEKPTFYDSSGMDTAYKVLCMDIDGIPDNATKDDCVNECPFGYGIRADGKILNGARADEWLEKSIQSKD